MNTKPTPVNPPMPTAQSAEGASSLPEKRFSRAALDYCDAVLDLQAARFDAHLSDLLWPLHEKIEPSPALPALQRLKAGVDFGSSLGWSEPEGDGSLGCWMSLTAGVALCADIRRGGTLSLKVSKSMRSDFPDLMEVRVNHQMAAQTSIERTKAGWTAQFDIAPQDWAWPSSVQIIAPKQVRRYPFSTRYVSVRISDIAFEAPT